MDKNTYQLTAQNYDDKGAGLDLNEHFESDGKTENLGDLLNYTLGLCGEAGELSERLQKTIFHGIPFNKTQMIKDLGDVLWYLTMCCKALQVPLEVVMDVNINKLSKRHPNGYTGEYMTSIGKVQSESE